MGVQIMFIRVSHFTWIVTQVRVLLSSQSDIPCWVTDVTLSTIITYNSWSINTTWGVDCGWERFTLLVRLDTAHLKLTSELFNIKQIKIYHTSISSLYLIFHSSRRMTSFKQNISGYYFMVEKIKIAIQYQPVQLISIYKILLEIPNNQDRKHNTVEKMNNAKQPDNDSQGQYESMTKSDSTSQVKSIISISSNSKMSHSNSIIDVVKCHLLGYEDVNDDEFQILPNQPIKDSMFDQYSSYMNYHATQVPIGPNFQANLPPVISTNKYFRRNQTKLQAIHQRKIHDPQIDANFYQKYKQLVQNMFGPERTYEDINQVRINFTKKCSYIDFQQYLKQPEIFEYWDDYFATKQKYLIKLKKKKKKVK